jgi:aminoglycoside/choline kinase family phosphotransferase
MSRRSTPERLDQARRAATLARLSGEGLSPERAADWMDRWAKEAERRGLPPDGAFWEAGWDWIASQRGQTRGALRQHDP